MFEFFGIRLFIFLFVFVLLFSLLFIQLFVIVLKMLENFSVFILLFLTNWWV